MAKLSPEAKLLLQLVPPDGEFIGNTSLQRKSKLRKRYWDVRQELLDGGYLDRGKGRGGSVARAATDAKVPQESRRGKLIEAVIYVMKQIAVEAHPDPKCPTISEAERAFAAEREVKLTAEGDVEQRAAKIPLETNIRFAFKLLAKASGVSTVLDVSGPEWQSLQRAIKVRDRITHPKTISDLAISDAELSDVVIGFRWLVTSHLKLGNDLKAVLREQSEIPSTNE